MYYSTVYPSPIGKLTICCDGENIVGLWIEGQRYFKENIQNSVEDSNLPVLTAAKSWLDRYFAGKKPGISELPLHPLGTDFRKSVWKALCEIPYGTVTTYGKIADKVALDTKKDQVSARAVGGAIGHNPISIIIPCHRVVGANGSLTGYAGGIETKLKLLRHEGADISGLYIPAKL